MADLKFQNRRQFLITTLGTAASFWAMSLKARIPSMFKEDVTKLTILYTNDQHSRIEPFPENDSKYAGMGGFAKRAKLIEQIRAENEHVLLLDAGDIFQGTPYFNYFHGELEYKLMSAMGYDAVTFGNHDFDMGCENILKQLTHANFDFINSNYDFSVTPLNKNKKIFPYKIYKKGKLKIGICGVGIDLSNLVDQRLVKGIIYKDPIQSANEIATLLKEKEKCDYIICLSHLGYKYENDKVSDVILASETQHIDLIIGGHTHTFLDSPHVMKNKLGLDVAITQVGWGGIWLGKTEITFSHHNNKIKQSNRNHEI